MEVKSKLTDAPLSSPTQVGCQVDVAGACVVEAAQRRDVSLELGQRLLFPEPLEAHNPGTQGRRGAPAKLGHHLRVLAPRANAPICISVEYAEADLDRQAELCHDLLETPAQ